MTCIQTAMKCLGCLHSKPRTRRQHPPAQRAQALPKTVSLNGWPFQMTVPGNDFVLGWISGNVTPNMLPLSTARRPHFNKSSQERKQFECQGRWRRITDIRSTHTYAAANQQPNTASFCSVPMGADSCHGALGAPVDALPHTHHDCQR